jgi:hypothetical protein
MAVMTALQLSFVCWPSLLNSTANPTLTSLSLQITRLKKTWTAFETSHPTLSAAYKNELVPLADPGNGIYANILERVTGTTQFIYIFRASKAKP